MNECRKSSPLSEEEASSKSSESDGEEEVKEVKEAPKVNEDREMPP